MLFVVIGSFVAMRYTSNLLERDKCHKRWELNTQFKVRYVDYVGCLVENKFGQEFDDSYVRYYVDITEK